MPFYINTQNQDSSREIARVLEKCIQRHKKDWSEIVFLCIGSDRSTGDCLGPLIGYKLAQLISPSDDVAVFGTLSHPVHAVNLLETINRIHRIYNDPFIIAIDASLGRRDHIGYITLGSGALRPGLGVKKKLPEVGDIHITGIVNLSGGVDTVILQTTRLATIMTLADAIASGLSKAIHSVTCQASCPLL